MNHLAVNRSFTSLGVSCFKSLRFPHRFSSISSFNRIASLPLLLPPSPTTQQTKQITINHRPFHTNISLNNYNSRRHSNFNRYPFILFPGGGLVPDAFKAILTIVGISSFIVFIAAPILIFVIPPLFLGGFIMSKVWYRRRQSGLTRLWNELSNTNLSYKGSILDQNKLEKFVQKRVIDAIISNEKGIIKTLGIDVQEQYHPFDTRFEIGGPESIDQDLKINRSFGTQEQLTLIPFALYDAESKERYNRVATLVLAIHPTTITSLLDIDNSSNQAVIEVRPTLPFKHPVILNTPSGFQETPVINIRAK